MLQETRATYMLEWWQQSLDLIVAERMNKKKIKDSVMSSDLYFRYGAKELFGAMSAGGLHCYVVSAGLGPIINQSFYIFGHQTALELSGKITVCSTEEKYNEDNCISGFNAPFITCANKFLLFTHPRYPALKPATNAILIGDLLDDLSMTSSLDLSNRLTIGMLNSKDLVSLEDYKKAFDIVIGVDGNLIHVAQILEGLCGIKKNDYDKYGENAKLISQLLEYP
eukprot:TRINITY_DN753_c0_g1_i1.p1 TRINITY_DN753_c0_g1~~TRINITY_DN753_c0_g1_i1.p1  ORF type:complete len:224 (+),score=22.46 TRINITY_DN753_c0_g1_i1:538-1209(+)